MAILRFAPSPTGPLHLGGLRMALYNHLYARKHGGKWILRIEDTDMSRFVPGSVDGIRKALSWAGLEYDYGPGKEGPHAPYFQAKRLDLYKTYAGKLLDSGHAYRCFCSPDTLAEAKTRLARAGSSASYDRKCLHLTEEEVARRVRAGEKNVVRFNATSLPSRPPTTDLIFGQLRDAHASLATDPILLKTDLFPTYHLASVVDDHEMGVTTEWMPSLPLHLDLYAALKVPPPDFGHMPILLNPDGSKMSKRHGDVRVEDFMKRGWEPEAVLNWVLLSGWGVAHKDDATTPSASSPTPAGTKPSSKDPSFVPDSTAIMNLREMVNNFDLSAITHRNTILDPRKLEYMNKRHVLRRTTTPEGLHDAAAQIHDRIKDAFPLSPYTSIPIIAKTITLLEGRLTNLYDVPAHAPYVFTDPKTESEEAKKMRVKVGDETYHKVVSTVHAALEKTMQEHEWEDRTVISSRLNEARTMLGLGMKPLMQSLRCAVTGMEDGPSIADIMSLIGRERTLERLAKAQT
ncbi:hypothetical protein D9619_003696 [Psilocybe cf. subviscida]|uniref:Glutamate--tRNA ligase n=1 Tax=Psilocybe cf. subviscida TaxID=2480587 RepID=A0A8H5AXF3_9AGAR|nr:hypothetical protein D9619_003696 [Psilocybe cf. subviscida]